MRLRSKP